MGRRMGFRLVIAAAALAVSITTANADQLDAWCAQVKLPSSIALCSDPELRALAEERQRAFDEARGRIGKERANQLLDDQKGWVASYPRACGIAPNVPPPLPLAPEVRDCMVRAARARIAYLRSYVGPAPADETPSANTGQVSPAGARTAGNSPLAPGTIIAPPPAPLAGAEVQPSTQACEEARRQMHLGHMDNLPNLKGCVPPPGSPDLAFTPAPPVAKTLVDEQRAEHTTEPVTLAYKTFKGLLGNAVVDQDKFRQAHPELSKLDDAALTKQMYRRATPELAKLDDLTFNTFVHWILLEAFAKGDIEKGQMVQLRRENPKFANLDDKAVTDIVRRETQNELDRQLRAAGAEIRTNQVSAAEWAGFSKLDSPAIRIVLSSTELAQRQPDAFKCLTDRMRLWPSDRTATVLEDCLVSPLFAREAINIMVRAYTNIVTQWSDKHCTVSLGGQSCTWAGLTLRFYYQGGR
jgi:hypothetical protein